MELSTKEYDATTVDGLKELLCKKCDDKVAVQNEIGFSFGGKQFSLSKTAQFNWLSMLTLSSSLTFPKLIGTIDNTGYLLTQDNLMPFIGTALQTVDNTLEACRMQKAEIMACTTLKELHVIQETL